MLAQDGVRMTGHPAITAGWLALPEIGPMADTLTTRLHPAREE